MSDDREQRFRDWACAKGYDVAYTYDTERSRHVWLNPMTNDLWGAWQAASAQSGWRPIETMPKDHASRLFLCGGAVVQGFMDVTDKFCVTHEFGWRMMNGKPEHWQPLPAAPRSSV